MNNNGWEVFLSLLYKAKFDLIAEEKKLSGIKDFPQEEGQKFSREQIRNDQSISETRKALQKIEKLIEQYLSLVVKNS